MKIAIMQPYLFPYLGYFQLLNHVDRFVAYDDVNFIKKGWINRNYILLHGKRHLFTVPLVRASQNKMIRDTLVHCGSDWQGSFLKTLESAYQRAPHFESVLALVKNTLASGAKSISDLAIFSVTEVMQYLGIETPVVAASSHFQNQHLKGPARILDICRQESATQYINPEGGMALYDREEFESTGIKLRFLKQHPIEYTQFGGAFVPYLSILDFLMFSPPATVRSALSKFDLI